MRIAPAALAFIAFATLPSLASAQRTPFFGPSGTAFDPEIGVVNTGELLDAQVAVSDDLKYVTINARPSSSRLLALRDFTFVGSGVRRGLVGNGVGEGDADGIGGNDGANNAPGAPPAGEADAEPDRVPKRRPSRAKPPATNDRAPDAQSAPPLPGGILARPGMTLIGRLED